MLREYLKQIADAIRSVLGNPSVNVWYDVALSYAEDDIDQEHPIFTKTDTVIELSDEEIEWIMENHKLDYTTTTGEDVYLNAENFCCCIATTKTTINAQDFPAKIAEVYEAGKAAGTAEYKAAM